MRLIAGAGKSSGLRRAGAVGLVVAVGATLFPGGAPVSAQDGGRSDRAAIQALLAARSEALLAGDEGAFMATVSRARPDFRRRQRRLFRWARRVPFSSYRLVARWDRFGDLSRPSDRASYPTATAVSIPLTEERYRIGAYDDRDAVEDLLYTFVRERGEWRIASDDDLEDVGLPSARHLWDFGPLTATESEHFLLLRHTCASDIGCASLSGEVLPLAEAAMRRVRSYWSAPWHRRVVILVPSSTGELGRMLQTTFDLDDFVAFAASSVDVERDFEYGGHRILFNPRSMSARPSSQVLTILAHELLHVATRPSSGPFVPTFLEEGLAEYVGYDGGGGALAFFDSIVAAGRFDGRLPADDEFLTGTGNDIYTSYQEGHSAISYFVQRWGFSRLVRFYRRVGEPSIAPGTSRYHVDRALRATVGIDLHAFQAAWAGSISE